MASLNPAQLRKWGELIEAYFGLDPELIEFVRNPPSIPDEADVDIRVWYPDESEPGGMRVVAEWSDSWSIWWT